jgi:ribosomal protein S12 methylthiotransferase
MADAPEIDGTVLLESGGDLAEGDLVDVQIIRAEAYDLHGVVAG